jgi:V-type H+-transporting ATPase subunit D
MNLQTFKVKQIAAKKGFDLLKNKLDALKVRFRDICKVIYSTKLGMADLSANAFFSLTEAEYAAGNFRTKILDSTLTAQVRVVSRTDHIAGVKLPVFSQYETGAEQMENLGLAGGGRKIQNCKNYFSTYLTALIKIASLQTSFLAIDEALKITNRRVNALENVTLPKIISVIAYINRFVVIIS